MHDDLAKLDAVTLSKHIRQKDVSPVEILSAVVAVIERENARLNAICTLSLENAMESARAIETHIMRGDDLGPLAGIPISIKDLIFTKSIRTTGGSVAYRDLIPDVDDIVVERLKAAGAIIFAKTNVSELGYSLTGDNLVFGTTRNPWDESRSSGGSSAGAAVAVATGMGPIAIGSDGGGSIRLPAAFCGIFGFKPSMGRVPLYPGCRDERFAGLSSWESLEHIGPMTRTVADAALTMAVIAGADPRDRHSIPSEISDWTASSRRKVKGLRFAYCPTWGPVAVEPEIAELTNAAVAAVEKDLGGIVEVVDAPWTNPVLHFRSLMAMESDLAGMRNLVERCGPNVSVNLKRFLAIEWTAEMFTEAIKVRKTIANAAWKLFEKYDVLLAPISARPAPLAEKQDNADDIERPLPTYTCIANMTGLPAAAVPIGWSSAGMPVGLQVIGSHLADLDVLAVASAIEETKPWCARWPRKTEFDGQR